MTQARSSDTLPQRFLRSSVISPLRRHAFDVVSRLAGWSALSIPPDRLTSGYPVDDYSAAVFITFRGRRIIRSSSHAGNVAMISNT